MEVFGIHLIGFTAENGRRLIITLVYVAAVLVAGWILRWGARRILTDKKLKRAAFWIEQVIRVAALGLLVVGIISIWFTNPSSMATAGGLVTAGVAVAAQRVITAFASYFILLRGKTFNVGDRIMMGGVRGDVMTLDFFQTTIMEMGQPPGEQGDAPSMWVQSRQYTGRIVTMTNDKIFEGPVYNYSREFPYIWEEMHIPVSYRDDRRKAEETLLQVARKHTVKISELSQDALHEIERRYQIRDSELEPRVFWRITDNWVELTLRFIANEHGVRDLKDRMSREILQLFDEAKIGIASSTYDIVGLPPIRIERQ